MNTNTQKGMTLIETAIGCLLSVIVIFGVTSTAQQSQKRLSSETYRVEMQQKARTAFDLMSNYIRSAGANRSGVFSAAPYTTSSVLPIPSASSASIRLRSDFDDNGTLGTSLPEDVTISWDSTADTLNVGPSRYDKVANLTLRYYDNDGVEMTPPTGGWNIAGDASHGDTLRSITRVQVELLVEGRHANAITGQIEQMTFTSDITVTNQRTE
jgi:Tfp pilus assembly protein PilW